MTTNSHRYHVKSIWTGAGGQGTATYAGYGRDIRAEIPGKTALALSADPAFRGDASKLNPEDLFVTAVSSCHMLTYLALCAKHRITVLAYEDTADGTLEMARDGGGAFSSITLHPVVTVAAGSDQALAHALHEQAGGLCFIARSCKTPIHHEATIQAAAD